MRLQLLMALLRAKLVENGFKHEIPIREIPLQAKLTLGPFDIELVTVAHSIPEPNGVIIKTAAGTAFHTGDWKIDEQPMDGEAFDFEAFERIGDEGVTLLLSDSTNALVEGWSVSERAVADALLPVIEGHDGRVVVTQFASMLPETILFQ